MTRRELCAGAGVSLAFALALASPALADDQQQAPTSSTPASAAATSAAASNSAPEVVITAQRLDVARDTIQPQVGASTYTLNAQAIQSLPAGEDTPLNQVILQAPGVAQDSFGQLHVRDEHNGLQYRLDGVILPEGLSVFGQALSPRFASNLELITGALPAEYGLRTAGIIDITTKSGVENGGSVTMYGGSQDDFEPSVEFRGSSGNFQYFVTGSYKQNDLGIESPDGSANPIHDDTKQWQGFAYLEDILDPDSRVTLMLGTSDERFQIPDVNGEQNGGLMAADPTNPAGSVPINVNGQTSFPSQDLNENQSENTQFAALSYLHTAGKLTSQVSLFGRYSTLDFTPDAVGDILYNGIAQTASKTDIAGGIQAEGAYTLDDHHTLRAGVIVEVDRAGSDTSSQVLLVNATSGALIGGADAQPFTVVDDGGQTSETYSVYVQDEWKILDNLTLNYGVRFDQFNGFRDENQASPRINLVWKATPTTTIHVGYARYFSPPPFELINNESVQKFVQPIPGSPNITSTGSPVVASCGQLLPTTACPLVTTDTTPFSERSNYYDVGASQKIGRSLTVTIDTYLAASQNLVDEGQFGAPIILTPFNYAEGRQYGVELTGSYAKGPFSAYANFAYQVGQGEGWTSSQFEFPQAQLDYVANHFIYLDHDERVAVSAGASYLLWGTRFGGDLIYGSGLRADSPLATSVTEPDGSVLGAIPNGEELPGYVQVNLAITHRFEQGPLGPLELRFDVTNVGDAVYQIRNGSGVGVFAPQYGPRRGFFFGVTKDF